jgi:hypothetical protein
MPVEKHVGDKVTPFRQWLMLACAWVNRDRSLPLGAPALPGRLGAELTCGVRRCNHGVARRATRPLDVASVLMGHPRRTVI